jgi:hypothetical protein
MSVLSIRFRYYMSAHEGAPVVTRKVAFSASSGEVSEKPVFKHDGSIVEIAAAGSKVRFADDAGRYS